MAQCMGAATDPSSPRRVELVTNRHPVKLQSCKSANSVVEPCDCKEQHVVLFTTADVGAAMPVYAPIAAGCATPSLHHRHRSRPQQRPTCLAGIHKGGHADDRFREIGRTWGQR